MFKTLSFMLLPLLFISLMSGMVLVFVYHPSMAYDSVQKITFVYPYGEIYRKVHYFSSELFLIFLIFHIVVEISKSKINISNSSWNYSIVAFLATIFFLFSGFVLKGDQSANAAANVTFTLIKDTPFVDALLPLVKDSDIITYKFFIWHILFLPIVLYFALLKHVRKLEIKLLYLGSSLFLVLILVIFFKMPVDIPLSAKGVELYSPWFFTGAEKLLSLSVSASLVNLALVLPVVFLFIFKVTKYKNILIALLLMWILAYTWVCIS